MPISYSTSTSTSIKNTQNHPHNTTNNTKHTPTRSTQSTTKQNKTKQNKTKRQQVKVAIIREEGSNGDREMAAAAYAAGLEPWDVTMSDLLEGRASLDAFRGVIFVGGFSYADVLDSAKGWAGAFLFILFFFDGVFGFQVWGVGGWVGGVLFLVLVRLGLRAPIGPTHKQHTNNTPTTHQQHTNNTLKTTPITTPITTQ